VRDWLIEKGISKQLEISDASEETSDQAEGIPGTAAVLARIPARSLLKYHKILSVLRSRRTSTGIIKLSTCVGLGECIVIAIMHAGAFEESRRLMLMLEKNFPDTWAMRFRGHDYEVGHWDGLRLREILLQTARRTL